MNERIIELAEQAGLSCESNGSIYALTNYLDCLKHFAELVRQDEREQCASDYLEDCARAIEKARLEEREACAKLCVEYHYEIGGSCKDAAAAIRGRTE